MIIIIKQLVIIIKKVITLYPIIYKHSGRFLSNF